MADNWKVDCSCNTTFNYLVFWFLSWKYVAWVKSGIVIVGFFVLCSFQEVATKVTHLKFPLCIVRQKKHCGLSISTD